MKHLILVLLASVGLLSTKCNGDDPVELPEITPLPASFNFKGNPAAMYNETVPITITIEDHSVAKMELIFDDETVKTWEQPSGTIEFEINTTEIGLGAHKLNLLITNKNGESFIDNRIMRVLSDTQPERWVVEIINSYPHNTTSFTQGLEFSEGQLYEGTGQYGESKVMKVDLHSGNITAKQALDGTKFGEGITILNDTLYQLTWKSGKCYLYDKHTLQPLLKEFEYATQGWGICNDGEHLIMSEGSEYLTFRDPETFAIRKTLQVYNHLGPIANLNELEYIDGFIYANVWQSNKVFVIDPLSGKVIAEMDASELKRQGAGAGEVLNGIAYDRTTGKTYMTGKRWEKLFEVSFKKPSPVS